MEPLWRTLTAREMHQLIGHLKLGAESGMSASRTLELCAMATELSSISKALEKAAVDTGMGMSLSGSLKRRLGHCAGSLFHGLMEVWEETRGSDLLEAIDSMYETLWRFSSSMKAQLIFPALGLCLLVLVRLWLTPSLLPLALILPGIYLAWKALIPLGTRSLIFSEILSYSPLVAGKYRRVMGSLFFRAYSTLMKAGCTVEQSRRLLLEAFPHSFMASDLNRAFQSMARGESMAMSLAPVSFINSAEKASIGVGEEAGALDQVLDRMSRAAMTQVELELKVALRLTAQLFSLIGSAVTGLALYMLISGSGGAIVEAFGK